MVTVNHILELRMLKYQTDICFITELEYWKVSSELKHQEIDKTNSIERIPDYYI